MQYAVTWMGEPEVIYRNRSELCEAVKVRATATVKELEGRLERGLTKLKGASGAEFDELSAHFQRLLDEHQLLLCVTQLQVEPPLQPALI